MKPIPSMLSGGQTATGQRSRFMPGMCRPKLLIADEPTTVGRNHSITTIELLENAEKNLAWRYC
ncbi:MAG: hypothetical protein R3E08_10730 [Thiotrichaceae bacterium]